MHFFNPVPELATPLCYLITFKHPYYDFPFLQLPAVDLLTPDDYIDVVVKPPPTHGLCHNTARTACQLVVGNNWDAYLSYDIRGEHVVTVDLAGVLTGRVYYVHIPGHVGPYPLTPSFKNWEFPTTLPAAWAALTHRQMNVRRPRRSTKCVISASKSVQYPDVIPLTQESWFRAHSMWRHDRLYPSNMGNELPLRDDLCADFGRGDFCLVPKDIGGGMQHLVVHFVSRRLRDARVQGAMATWQNQLVGHIEHVPREFLLARFAYCVLGHVQEMVAEAEQPLVVTVLQKYATDYVRARNKWMQPDDLWNRFGPRLDKGGPDDDEEDSSYDTDESMADADDAK